MLLPSMWQTYSLGEGEVIMTKLKPCPFCGGRFEIILCDYEGNVREYDEEYKKQPYSGVQYAIFHDPDINSDCQIARYGQMGECLYDTVEEAIKVCNIRHEPPTPGGAIVPAGNERLKR